MCGRFNLLATPKQVQEAFKLDALNDYETSYNIAPGQNILNITQAPDDSYQAAYTYWGLVPSWSKDKKNSSHLINARAETLTEKPSFRTAYKKRRCLIPASGFYEWHKTDTGKQAYLISRQDNQVFAFAGLWEYWEHDAATLYSCTIITTAANSLMLPIHERMPIIIAPEHYRDWLNPKHDLKHVITEDAYAGMYLKPISSRVDNPAHNDKNCLE